MSTKIVDMQTINVMKNIKQLPLFKEDIFYISLGDAAKHLGVTTRMINYWEKMGLLHPEITQSGGKARKCTPLDMLEMTFIKKMIVDNGYTVSGLKEKLEKLATPYYYKAEDIFWDLKAQDWKTKEDFTYETILNNELMTDKLKKILDSKKRNISIEECKEIINNLAEKVIDNS